MVATVPEHLREARSRAGLTQRSLAERLGVPQSSVARWESGAVEPRASAYLDFLAACGQRVVIEVAPLADPADLVAVDAALAMTPAARVRSNQRLSRIAQHAAQARRQAGS